MPFDIRIGVLCKMYLNTGTWETPVWEEVDLISDLADNAAWERGDSSARRSRVRTMEPTMLSLELTGRIRTDYTDDRYNDIRDAFGDNTVIDVMALTGDIGVNGSLGFRFDAKVFDFGSDQALGNVIFNDFAIIPCASDNPPQMAQSNGSAVTFSSLGTET
jgi:hypothetical protein